MVFVPPKDRVLEHSTSNSQTVFAVTGALDTSYNAFSASMSVGDTTIGGVVEAGTAFVSGLLTYSATNQVTVTTAFESKGTFSSGGVKEVFMGLPASRTLMMDGSSPLTLTQQAQVLANIGAASSGLINKFRNGAMDVWQRGLSSITVGTGGTTISDGWIVQSTGANASALQAAGRLSTVNSLKIVGATSVTDMLCKQRIESYLSAPLASQQVTVQAQVFNGTGSSITPTLTVKHPTVQDNYGSTTTDISAVSLQACANGVWTLVSYTFAGSASSALGIEVTFDFGNNFSTTGKFVQITECDIRATSGIVAGLNSAPPTPELRLIANELAMCQRYYEIGNCQMNNAAFAATANGSSWVAFKTTKRVAPTVTQTNTSNSNCTATPGQQSPVVDGFLSSRGATASGNFSFSETWIASAEL